MRVSKALLATKRNVFETVTRDQKGRVLEDFTRLYNRLLATKREHATFETVYSRPKETMLAQNRKCAKVFDCSEDGLCAFGVVFALSCNSTRVPLSMLVSHKSVFTSLNRGNSVF